LQTLLPELVYVTQSLHDQKILTAAKDNLRKRLRQASGLTFMDYSEKIALPLWRVQLSEPEADLDTFIKKGAFGAIVDRLRGNSKVQVIHNADDPLSDMKSIEALKEALGDQLMLYPYGGHLGNIWYPQNREYMLSVFKTAQ